MEHVKYFFRFKGREADKIVECPIFEIFKRLPFPTTTLSEPANGVCEFKLLANGVSMYQLPSPTVDGVANHYSKLIVHC